MSCSSLISGSGFEEVRVRFPEKLFFGATISSPLIKTESFLLFPAGILRESSGMEPDLEILLATNFR